MAVGEGGEALPQPGGVGFAEEDLAAADVADNGAAVEDGDDDAGDVVAAQEEVRSGDAVDFADGFFDVEPAVTAAGGVAEEGAESGVVVGFGDVMAGGVDEGEAEADGFGEFVEQGAEGAGVEQDAQVGFAEGTDGGRGLGEQALEFGGAVDDDEFELAPGVVEDFVAGVGGNVFDVAGAEGVGFVVDDLGAGAGDDVDDLLVAGVEVFFLDGAGVEGDEADAHPLDVEVAGLDEPEYGAPFEGLRFAEPTDFGHEGHLLSDEKRPDRRSGLGVNRDDVVTLSSFWG